MAKNSFIKDYITPERNGGSGRNGAAEGFGLLLPAEGAMVLYALFTLVMVLFTTTTLDNADSLLWERMRVVATTLALWVVYRLWPCRLMVFVRIVVLLLFLGWWYPDTYELNRQLPNLDHLFASAEQYIFGCQPALIWCERYASPVLAEMMDFGYAMYYPMFSILICIIFLRDYKNFNRVSFVILAAFYIYYIIYDLLPVTGPQYYYLAAGIGNIAAGHFPDVADYFATHTEALPTPGYENGIFHAMVEAAHSSGERPTAAFPSSHVGIATLTMIVAIRLKQWKYLAVCAIPYVLLCFSTVYIQAHYAIDAIAGFVTAIPLAFGLDWTYLKLWGNGRGH